MAFSLVSRSSISTVLSSSMTFWRSVSAFFFCSAISSGVWSFGSFLESSLILASSSGVTGGRSSSTVLTTFATLRPTMTSTMMSTPTTLVIVSMRATKGSSCSSCLRLAMADQGALGGAGAFFGVSAFFLSLAFAGADGAGAAAGGGGTLPRNFSNIFKSSTPRPGTGSLETRRL